MEAMELIGFEKGKSCPCTFVHEARELRAVVHGDDFTVLGWENQLDWFWQKIKEKFECKHRGRIGPKAKDAKSIRILNRVVTWTEEGIEYEGDQRHVEICMKELKLCEDSKEVTTPGEKSQKKNQSREVLGRDESKKFRGITARLNYLGQDRSDIQNAAKELSKAMANPTDEDLIKAKRVVRYLKGRPRFVLKYGYQEKPTGLSVWTDTDFAGCSKTRKSTSGGLIMHGTHVIKSWSTIQAVIALSSGEAEYYGLVKGASVALGIKRYQKM